MSPALILGLIASCVGAVATLGSVVVFFGRAADKGTIESLESSVRALQIEDGLKDKKIAKQDVTIAAQGAQLRSLEAALQAARELATGAAKVDDLRMSLDSHHAESMHILEAIQQKVAS